MLVTTQDVRQFLMAKDPEFRSLAEQHSRCESQLEQIVKSPYLSRAEDLVEEAMLKKAQAPPERSDGVHSLQASTVSSLGPRKRLASVVQYICIPKGRSHHSAGVLPISYRPRLFRRGRKTSTQMIKDAYKFAVPPIVAGIACLFFDWKLPAAILILLGGFIFYFFRDPDRAIPADTAAIVSPADGKVVDIASEEFDSRSGTRISIFLSIWNVHVQRAPVEGRIAEVAYRPGRFFGAYRARASEENEQNVIYMDTPHGTLVFKQIAGAIARRVLCWKRKRRNGRPR